MSLRTITESDSFPGIAIAVPGLAMETPGMSLLL